LPSAVLRRTALSSDTNGHEISSPVVVISFSDFSEITVSKELYVCNW
jgi:hypothetical protein